MLNKHKMTNKKNKIIILRGIKRKNKKKFYKKMIKNNKIMLIILNNNRSNNKVKVGVNLKFSKIIKMTKIYKKVNKSLFRANGNRKHFNKK